MTANVFVVKTNPFAATELADIAIALVVAATGIHLIEETQIMMTTALEKSFISLKRHISEYRPQLETALAAIKQLEASDPDSEEFSQALADLHVAATVLEPYSEGIVEAINQFTEDRSD